MITGYEQIYLDLLPRLSECDLVESARRLGLEVLPSGEVSANFCGRKYLITHTGVTPADDEPVNVNCRSVLAHYILSKGRAEPEHSFLPLSRMTGMPDGQKTFDKGMMVKPLLREFGNDYEAFQSATLRLGGVLENASDNHEHRWTFTVLPKILLRLVYHDADEEFPADIQLLFDRAAPRILEFECLAFLSGCFIHSLIAAARDMKTHIPVCQTPE
jgi:hypothetical protein